jgi:hypothetical protein
VAVIVLLLAIVLMRHSRSTPQASLITRSFEREKRP